MKKMISKIENSSGFTLIEIMIAIFILVVALLGLISVTVMVIKGNSISKTMTTATTLAADKMEQLKRTGYDNSIGGTDTSNVGYSITWTVSNDGDPAAGMKTIVVTVDRPGIGNDVVLRTIVAK